MKKSKAITFRLSESEYEKVQMLAEQRHMNATEYARHVALGNRIKPTVINIENDTTLSEDLANVELENEELLNMIHSIQDYIAENGFINWHEYKNDEVAVNSLLRMKRLK